MSSDSNDVSTGSAQIPGGYYIVPRKRQQMHGAPPITRDIYNYLTAQANYEERESSGRIIGRGQCVRTYDDIQEGLVWYVGYRKMRYSKDQIENSLKWLEKHKLITKTKTTRGLIITIEKYDFYQTQANYENRSDNQKKTTTDPQPADTINNELEEEKKNTLLGLATKRLPDFFYKDILSLNSEESTYTTQYLRAEFERRCRKAGKRSYYRENIYGRKIREKFSPHNMNFAHVINLLYYYFDAYRLSNDVVGFFNCFSYDTIRRYKEDWSEVKHLYNRSELPVSDIAWWRDLYDPD